MKEIQEHKIKIYEFPDTEDEEDNKLIRKIKVINRARRMLVIYASTLLSHYLSQESIHLCISFTHH